MLVPTGNDESEDLIAPVNNENDSIRKPQGTYNDTIGKPYGEHKKQSKCAFLNVFSQGI